MDLEVAKNEALFLMNKHGLLDEGWQFKYDNAKRRFGCCNYRKKQISLSSLLVSLNEFEKVNDTILHEIAHALTPGAHHGPKWVAKAKEIGCKGERCYDPKKVNTVKGKYVAICGTCNNVSYRHKTPKKGRKFSCGKCSNKFDPAYILDYVLCVD